MCQDCVSNFVFMFLLYISLAEKHVHGKYAREEAYFAVSFFFSPVLSQFSPACLLKKAANITDVELLVECSEK